MKMWICRTKEHGLYLTPLIPRYHEDIDFWCYSKEYEDGTHMLNAGLELDSELYPEVTFENSPMEVELINKSEFDSLLDVKEKYEEFLGIVAEMRHLQKEQDKWNDTSYYESLRKRMSELQKEVDYWLNLN